MDWKRWMQFAMLGSGELESICHLAGTRFDRAVLRHLRGEQIVCRQRHETGLRHAG